jgi:DNA-directed RNA polymerase II subunit RPB4
LHFIIIIIIMVDGSTNNTNNNNNDTTTLQIENVAELQFGDDFHDIHILSNAQVAVVLQVSADSAVTRDEELHNVYRQTQKYTSRFNTMTNMEKPHQEIVDELDNLQE